MSAILPRENMTEKERLEAILKNTEAVTAVTVAKYFVGWMQNFRENLPYMWRDADIKDMPKAAYKRSAVVIGGGPSLKKFNHLEVLARSKYKETVFCSDKMFKDAINSGVHVDYVVNLDSSPLTIPFIDHVHSPETSLILTSMAHPDLRKAWQGRVYWFCDDLAHCTHPQSLAEALAIVANKTWTSSGASVGSACVNMAWFTEHSPIALIGMDMSYDIGEPLEVTPYWENYVHDIGLDKAHLAFFKGHNPYWNNDFWMDYVFEIYRNEILNRIRHFKMPIWNCSGQGSLFGEGVKCANFSQFLKKYG